MNFAERFIHTMTHSMVMSTTYFAVCYYILAGLLGVVIGSFLNVVIYRLPEKMNLSFPPSHCPKCNYKLKWYDNIPILSYIMLGGKCRNCKTHISFRYTIVEAANMILWLACAFLIFGTSFLGDATTTERATAVMHFPYSIICMIACSVFICIAFIDLDHTYIPDRFQIILGVLGVAAIIFNLLGFDDGITWQERLIGAGGSLVLFVIIYFAGMLAYKREAMGIGDIKLVTVGGLLLGWKNMISAVLIGAVVGAVTMLILRKVRNDEKEHEYPLGPFLVLGMIVAMFFGEQIVNVYLSLMV